MALLMVFLLLDIAQACPVCDSAAAQEVRNGLIGEGLGKAVAAVFLPFIFLLAWLRFYHAGFAGFFRRTSLKS